ncbi:MAG TPA: sigma-54 dependent transcriptional regulator [Desulfuromonadaceae bacterium]|jgi:DNA-binding NtrC family response regulator
MLNDSKIILVDNDKKTADLVSAFLCYQGYHVTNFKDDIELFDSIRKQRELIIIADVLFLKSIAADFIEKAKQINPFLMFVVYGDKSQKILHSHDDFVFFLPKPLNLDEMESLVMRACESQAMRFHDQASASSRQVLNASIIGRSTPMQALYEMIEKVAASNATVLIQGESGTGKELAARAIHQLSSRNSRNFVPVNCAAIPDDLLESELFGHVKGSFTGAFANRAGRFEMADKGTLFLDEIGDMKANLQVKLLRVLQNREFEPVGSSKSQKVDVRIIAATNKNLEDLVISRDFREDLYYRLSVIPIVIPPLRERGEDIPLLIHNFLGRFNSDRKHSVKGFSRDALETLCNYSWPGNVRELENLVERMVIMKDSGFITPDDLPEKYLCFRPPVQAPLLAVGNKLPPKGICLNSAVDEFENGLILQALSRTRGNKKEAALLLNLKRTTLIEKLKKKNLVYGEDCIP